MPKKSATIHLALDLDHARPRAPLTACLFRDLFATLAASAKGRTDGQLPLSCPGRLLHPRLVFGTPEQGLPEDRLNGQDRYLQEFHSGEFRRSLALPFPVEAERATAGFSNGVLTLTLPKAEAAKPKTIRIGVGEHQREQLTGGDQPEKQH